MPAREPDLPHLPEDSESLRALLRMLLEERDQQTQRANDLQLQILHLQVELERYRKLYYGPRADRLRSLDDLAQMLLQFAEQLEQKPIHPEDVAPNTTPDYAPRRVNKRKGRRALASFENLPVTTRVYDLSAEQRACPCCGVERKEIGNEESWQIEYIPGRFERIQHVRKKYACAGCESNAENPRIELAAKPETAIEKGMAGPGLLAYIVTSKFSDYVGPAVM